MKSLWLDRSNRWSTHSFGQKFLQECATPFWNSSSEHFSISVAYLPRKQQIVSSLFKFSLHRGRGIPASTSFHKSSRWLWWRERTIAFNIDLIKFFFTQLATTLTLLNVGFILFSLIAATYFRTFNVNGFQERGCSLSIVSRRNSRQTEMIL